jgi:hypothetical protein
MDPVLCVCVYVLCVWCPSQLAQYRLQITGGAVLSRRGAMAKSKHATHAVCAGASCVRVRAYVRTCVEQDGETPVEIDEPQIDEPQVHGFRR